MKIEKGQVRPVHSFQRYKGSGVGDSAFVPLQDVDDIDLFGVTGACYLRDDNQ